MTASQDQLVQEFEKFLGNKPYFSSSKLLRLGVFGSASGLAKVIQSGKLPSLKVSPKRTVVSREAVLQYFRDNLKAEACNVGNHP